MRYLAVDFGSTYTKVTAVDTGAPKILGTACAFTTIQTDVMDGLRAALDALEAQIGEFVYDELLCCSSAAGGLKMVALGLVPELTSKAAKMAAASAGAKVVKTYAYEISDSERQEIYDIDPDLVLLCGGTDGGNKEVIISNARLLCAIDRNFSVIIAGNKSASRDLESIFKNSGKNYLITENVMPVFGKLNIEPAKAGIRNLFIRRIIQAKGLSAVQDMTRHEIIPTPLAVLQGCELLSRGTQSNPGLGEFMAIDVGGATTDVYSMSKGAPTLENVLVKGLPEPYAKRTVEGDLGMRYSLRSLLDEVGAETAAELAGTSVDAVCAWISACIAAPGTIPSSGSVEQCIDEALARAAVTKAVERHCGTMEKGYTPMGEIFVLTGKDLSDIPYVIGIGGILAKGSNPENILQGAVYTPGQLGCMLPRQPEFLLDKQYIFSAMGLIGTIDPDAALSIMKHEITPLREGENGIKKPENI